MAAHSFRVAIAPADAPETAPLAAPTAADRLALVFAPHQSAAQLLNAGVIPPVPEAPPGAPQELQAAPSDDQTVDMPVTPVLALPVPPVVAMAAPIEDSQVPPLAEPKALPKEGKATHQVDTPALHQAESQVALQPEVAAGYFDIECEPRSGKGRAVLSLGRIRTHDQHHQMLVLLPKDLALRLDKLVDGHKAPAITGLLQWALDKLDEEQVTLTMRNRSK